MSSIQPSPWPLDVLPDAVRRELLDGAPALALEPGQVLYRTGDSATSFFVVSDGELELLIKARTKDQPDARPVAKGCVVGIEALLAERDHLEEARAKGRAVVLEIGRGRFERARRDPAARERLAQAREVALKRRAETTLEASTLGRGLPDALFDAVVSACEWTTRKRGEVLWAPGDRADVALLVAEGIVRLVRDDRTVAYLQAGDVVGIEDVAAGVARSLRAVTDTPLEAFRIPAATIQRVAKDAPDFLSRASRAATERQDAIRAAVAAQGSVAALLSEAYRLEVAGAMLVIDPNTCVRCGICSWSCAEVHGAARLVRHGDKLLFPTAAAGSETRPLLLPNSCQHCTNPACMQDCPTAAIARSTEGEVYVREDLCTGCGNCARDCPWDNIVLAPRVGHPKYDSVAVKCDLCRGYGVSACVHNCPTGAIFRITPADDVAALRLLAPSLGGARPGARGTGRHGIGARALAWLVPLALFVSPAAFFAITAPAARSIGTGGAAAATMLALASYGLRKRAIGVAMRFWKDLAGRAGGGAGLEGTVDLRFWLSSHVVIGASLLLWVVAHAGAALGGPVTLGLILSTILAVVTGGVGLALYRFLPRRLARVEDRARLPEDHERDIEAARASLGRMLERLGDAPRAVVERARAASSAWGAVLAGRPAAEEAERLWQILSVEDRRLAGAAGRRAVDELALERTLTGTLALARSMRAWLPLHVGSMVAALGLTAVHVVQALG
jgi:Fe-S-cluster-containing dehydrogenase component/CRP-like cAMP-binding protein